MYTAMCSGWAEEDVRRQRVHGHLCPRWIQKRFGITLAQSATSPIAGKSNHIN